MTAPAPKPCPFCGSFAKEQADYGEEPQVYIYCSNDECWLYDGGASLEQWNRRPQQSAEPVATVGANGKPVVHAGTCLMTGAKLYLASPGPSELVEEMEKLAAELEDHKIIHASDCADRLRALIERHRGKS